MVDGMSKESFNQLRADVGLIDLIECTQQENEHFAELEKNGGDLPEDICKAVNDGGGEPCYYHCHSKAKSEKEELYVLMRISKDLHFIKVLFEVLLVLSIIFVLLALAFGLNN